MFCIPTVEEVMSEFGNLRKTVLVADKVMNHFGWSEEYITTSDDFITFELNGWEQLRRASAENAKLQCSQPYSEKTFVMRFDIKHARVYVPRKKFDDIEALKEFFLTTGPDQGIGLRLTHMYDIRWNDNGTKMSWFDLNRENRSLDETTNGIIQYMEDVLASVDLVRSLLQKIKKIVDVGLEGIPCLKDKKTE